MIDVLIIVVLIGACIAGYHQGVVKQLGSIAALVLAWLACLVLGDTAASVAASVAASAMGEDTSMQSARLVGCGVLFLVIWVAVDIVARMIDTVVRIVHLGLLNNLAGAALMIIKAALALSVLFNIYIGINPDSSLSIDPDGLESAIIGLLQSII